MTGHHPDVVGQLQQAMEAVEEPFGTVACVDGEVGPRRGAHEQRVAGQQGVAGEEAAVLRPVAGRVQRLDRDRADGDLVSVLERIVRVCGAGAAVDRHRQPVLQRKPAVPGDVVGVRVRLEHARDPEAARGGLLEEGLDRVRGVDEHRLARLLVTDQVRRAAEVVVDELAQVHRGVNVPPAPAVLLEVRKTVPGTEV